MLSSRERSQSAVTTASSQLDRDNRLKCELAFHGVDDGLRTRSDQHTGVTSHARQGRADGASNPPDHAR